MSEQEMNAYRFSSGQEPTDEMLSQLMKEVAQEAREDSVRIANAYFEQMQRNIAMKKQMWAEQIREAVNG